MFEPFTACGWLDIDVGSVADILHRNAGILFVIRVKKTRTAKGIRFILIIARFRRFSLLYSIIKLIS